MNKKDCYGCNSYRKSMDGPYCGHEIIRSLHEKSLIDGYDDMIYCKDGFPIPPKWCPDNFMVEFEEDLEKIVLEKIREK